MAEIDLSKLRKAGDPPLEPSPEEIKVMETLAGEHAAMHEAVLGLLHTWSHLEGELSLILATAASIRDPVVASEIFFASNNTHTQKKMLDGVISHLRRYHHPSSHLLPEFENIVAEWKALRKRYGQLKEYRDAAAHRIISTVAIPDQGQHIVLSYPFQNFGGMIKAWDNDDMLRFTAAKMKEAARESERLLADVTAFLERLRRHLQALGAGTPG